MLAGFNEYILECIYDYQIIRISDAYPQIQGISFTGLRAAGSVIGATARIGRIGSILCIVKCQCRLAFQLALKSRVANSKQVCFSAKRFIVHFQNDDIFKQKLVNALKKLIIGDPVLETTELRPQDLITNLMHQIKKGVEEGAKKALDQRSRKFYLPTVVEVDEKNILAKEETFGSLFALKKANSNSEILRIANNTSYGVVVSIDKKDIEQFVNHVEAGMVFVNEIVKSDHLEVSKDLDMEENVVNGKSKTFLMLRQFGLHEIVSIIFIIQIRIRIIIQYI